MALSWQSKPLSAIDSLGLSCKVIYKTGVRQPHGSHCGLTCSLLHSSASGHGQLLHWGHITKALLRGLCQWTPNLEPLQELAQLEDCEQSSAFGRAPGIFLYGVLDVVRKDLWSEMGLMSSDLRSSSGSIRSDQTWRLASASVEQNM